jgi:hypothetical protein
LLFLKAARNIKAKVINNKDIINTVQETVFSKDFKVQLDEALATKDLTSMKKVYSTLEPLIKVTSSNIPFSQAESMQTRSWIKSMVLYAGQISWFWTLALDDVHNILSIRYYINKKNDKYGKELIDEIYNNSESFELYKSAANNPFPLTMIYYRVIEKVCEHLIGLKISNKSSNKRSESIRFRKKGLFGHITSLLCVHETSGRGSLHCHIAAIGGLTSKLLETIANKEYLVKIVLEAYDSMVRAEISREGHVARIQKSINITNKTHNKNIKPAYSMSPLYNDADKNVISIDKRIEEIVGTSNIHKHTQSCHEGESGKLHCRFAYPQPLNPKGTRQYLIQLKENRTEPVIKRVDTSKFSEEEKQKEQEFYQKELEEKRLTSKMYYTCIEDCLPDSSVPTPIKKLNSFPKSQYGANVRLPLPPADERNIVYELNRQPLQEVLKDSNESVASKCIRKDMNRRIVAYNETLTSILCSNTAIYPLGVTETSKVISEYLGSYLTKDIVSLKAVLAAGKILIIYKLLLLYYIIVYYSYR